MDKPSDIYPPSPELVDEISRAIQRAFLSDGRTVTVELVRPARMSFFVTEPRTDGSRGVQSLTFSDKGAIARRLMVAGVPGHAVKAGVGEGSADQLMIAVDWRLVGSAAFHPSSHGIGIVHGSPEHVEAMKADLDQALEDGLANRLDATGVVLSLSLPVLREVEKVSALVQGLAGVPHKHFATKVKSDAVARFFGVADVQEITLPMLNSARRAAEISPPMVMPKVNHDGALAVSEIAVFRTIDLLARIKAGADPSTLAEEIGWVSDQWSAEAKGLKAVSGRYGDPEPTAPAAASTPSP